MRISLVLVFSFVAQIALAQGFERPIYDWTTRIWEIIPIDEDRIEVVAGTNPDEGHTQIYYVVQDSIGPKRAYHSSTITNLGWWYFSHSFDWGRHHRVYYENGTDGIFRRYGLNIGLYNLDDFLVYKRFTPPYFSHIINLGMPFF